MKLIDKEKVVDEIERRIVYLVTFAEFKKIVLGINLNIKIKRKRKDMTRKEEIEMIARDYENKIIENNPSAESYDYMNAVIYGAEWADRTMVEKVYNFIRINAYRYRQLKFVKNKATFDFRTDRLIEDLRKAMEE